MKQYDVIIAGGGPAGYTAALYAARGGLSTLVLEPFSPGGQMTETPEIDNYPGFPDGIDGYTLGEKMYAGALRFGAETQRAQVMEVELTSPVKKLITDAGEFRAKSVILAMGAAHRHLGLAHEEELIGRGVGYCAACDGMLYRNSAVADALLLARICKKVYLIHRRDRLRADRVYDAALGKAENLEIIWNSEVKELQFDVRLQGAILKNKLDGTEQTLVLDGLFISVGRNPNTAMLQGQLALDEVGYIVANESTQTSVAGVFAAGDIRTKPLRQIVTAAADGAVAAHAAQEYLEREGLLEL